MLFLKMFMTPQIPEEVLAESNPNGSGCSTLRAILILISTKISGFKFNSHLARWDSLDIIQNILADGV